MCRDVYMYIAVYLPYTAENAICMQNLDSTVLYALLQLSGEATALKTWKESIYEELLMGFGK